MQNLVAVIVYLSYLLLPGALVVYIFGFKTNRFLLAFGISFSFLIITQLPFRWAGGSVSEWIFAIHLCFLFMLALAIGIFFRAGNDRHFNFSSANQCVPYLVGFFAVVVLTTIYQLFAGPYTEIPSDYWEHLARVVSSTIQISEDEFNTNTASFDNFISQSDLTHFLHAVVAQKLEEHPLNLTFGATLSLGIIFLSSIYWFTIRLLSNTSLSVVARASTGLLAACLTALTFGTASFSYFRYYAYFPTIFCFPIVYLCVLITVEYLENLNFTTARLSLLPIFLFVLAITHTQEALFVLVLVIGIVIWRTARTYHQSSHIDSKLYFRHRVFALLAILFVLIFISATLVYRDPPMFLETPHIQIFSFSWLLSDQIIIAKPTFRFWDTLGYFGVLAYLCYILRWQLYRGFDYINIAMAVPLITHFNPLYSLVFLYYQSPSTLWRTSYLIPLSIVVAYYMVHTLVSHLQSKRRSQLICFTALVLLIGLSLIPLQFGQFVNRTTKLPSLASVEDNSGALLWKDLISKVSNLNEERLIRGILTDNVTKFVLDAAVFGRIPIRDSEEYFPYHNRDYKIDIANSDFSHHLLITNTRNGTVTHSSLVSGHWPSDFLNVSSRYPHDLELFLKENHSKFDLLWNHNNISIYQIYSFLN